MLIWKKLNLFYYIANYVNKRLILCNVGFSCAARLFSDLALEYWGFKFQTPFFVSIIFCRVSENLSNIANLNTGQKTIDFSIKNRCRIQPPLLLRGQISTPIQFVDTMHHVLKAWCMICGVDLWHTGTIGTERTDLSQLFQISAIAMLLRISK